MRESVEMIRAAGATPCGVVIALDRMERGTGSLSAVQEVERDYGIPWLPSRRWRTCSLSSADGLTSGCRANEAAVAAYRKGYGVARG